MVALTQKRFGAQYGWFSHGRSHIYIYMAVTDTIYKPVVTTVQYPIVILWLVPGTYTDCLDMILSYQTPHMHIIGAKHE